MFRESWHFFLTTICARPGTLPPEVGKLVKLTALSLSYTKIAGKFSKTYPLDQLPKRADNNQFQIQFGMSENRGTFF